MIKKYLWYLDKEVFWVEYEYSFKVDSLDEYKKYCEENGYEKRLEYDQVRELFTSDNKVLARITTTKTGENTDVFLDFKDDDDSDKVYKESRETIPLRVTDENRGAIDSILNILGYKKKKHLVRKRYIYKKGKVKFEMDDYTKPEIMHVVAIEGDKDEVTKVYNEIK